MTSRDKVKIRISDNVWNPHFKYMNDDTNRYLVLKGSAGSGKSYYVVQRYIRKILKGSGLVNVLVVRQTGKTNRDSTFALFRQVISKWGLNAEFKVNMSDLRITCMNGSEIIFAGLDDVEKLKSITFSNGVLSDVWVEEATEISEADFNQLDVRLRGEGVSKQIVISFNPVNIEHWIRYRFFVNTPSNATVDESTYKDNKHLDEEYIKTLESYKDTDPYTYEVYALGHWGILGDSVFDSKAIHERLQCISKPLTTGYFVYNYDGLRITSQKWIDDPNGYISIYAKPSSSLRYCIGGDTAGDGSDWFVGQVLSQSGEQVAVLRQQTDSDIWTKQMYCLGKYYNNALLTIEVNFDSYPIQELQRIGYNHMFIRKQNDNAIDRYKKAYGFRTDSWTRPKILNRLIEIVRDHTEFINDKATLEEMLTFVRNDKMRMEAAQGAHDDMVMSLAIAYEGLEQVPIKKPKEKPVPDAFSNDYGDKQENFDDYWG